MLILSRKNGQKIIINDEIEITILESKMDNCKIAINAPKDVQIQNANKQSESTSLADLGSLSDLMPHDKKSAPKKVILKKNSPENQ